MRKSLHFVSAARLPGVAVLVLLMFTASCATFGGDDTYEDDYSAVSTPPPPDYVYYEFSDVPIPRELSRDEAATFIVESPPLKSGVLVFDGGLDRQSLLDFFIEAMPNSGWTARSIFRAPRSLLIYEKDGRYCVISVASGRFLKTQVELWVTTGNAEAVSVPNNYGAGSSESFIE